MADIKAGMIYANDDGWYPVVVDRIESNTVYYHSKDTSSYPNPNLSDYARPVDDFARRFPRLIGPCPAVR